MIKVAAFTGKVTYPSTRFRVLQYIDYLYNDNIKMSILNTSVGRYPVSYKTSKRILWGIQNILENIPNVLASYKHDITFIQREMMSTFYTLERFTKSPRILDVDDAIFASRNGSAAKKIAQNVDMVICGNDYLANWFGQYNKDIVIIPTAVDATKFHSLGRKTHTSERVYLVWSGTSGGYRFLYKSGIIDALKLLQEKYANLYLRIISDLPPSFELKQLEYVKWSEGTEVIYMQDCDIGLMPLDDDEFAKGKCSYKMLTYMSCGLPVIVSPVGMNQEVLNLGGIGMEARDKNDWIEAIEVLINNTGLRIKMGEMGRKIIKTKFDLPIVAKELGTAIKSMC